MRISDHFLEIERGRYKKINNKRIPRDGARARARDRARYREKIKR